MYLYHTGFQEIREPDLTIGRKNADFGQGFYLTSDKDFSERWAKERKGSQTYVNTYEFCPDGLKILHFERNEEWFDYIYGNRNGRADCLKEMDVITGPIANDTIYDVMGITTSGILSREQSLQLLQIGPVYQQIAIKSQKAIGQLHWLSARVLEPSELAGYKKIVQQEEKKFQTLLAEKLDQLVD
ncbi:MAG: DUF3990 domain-containing protein [Blautia sp.]|nr:DUF3990 domain-containing protein [Blautia sp.]